MMTPQQLRSSILQLAIQGKLVEQRPEEGTGAELLEKVLATKGGTRSRASALMTGGTGATSGTGARPSRPARRNACPAGPASPASPTPVSPEDAPFEIPENWVWVRLGEVFQHNTGKALNSSDKTGTPLSYITTSNVYWNRFELDKLKTMLFSDSEVEKCTVQKGDLLVLEGGDVGRAAIWNYDFPMRIQNHIHRLRPLIEISVKYVYYIFMLYKNANMINGKGISIKGLSANSLHNLLIPLPPLAEQKRIVAKIEELLPYVERYEKAWSRLEEFNRRFPEDMRKSVLQMAIQGKLVEQRPEEGTGAELLREILAAKNAKTAKGNLTRSRGVRGEKNTSALSAPPREEISDPPFEIPESWVWVRLGEIGSWASGATPSRTQTAYYGGDIPWLKTGDLTDGYVSSVPESITDLALEKTSVRLNPVGSVLMAMYGATIGKLGILQVAATTNQACCACIPYDGVWNKYLFYYLMARRKAFIKMGEGGAQPNISKEKIVNAPIPLPPLAEQKRIVAKLEEILPLCERLEKSLEDTP